MDPAVERQRASGGPGRTPGAAVGRKRRANEPLAFVVQKHATDRPHYDLRLELDGVLKSWSVAEGPSMDPKERRLAVMTRDRPLEYAAFEGVVSEDEPGAGEVIVWDNGVYSPNGEESFFISDRAEAEKRVRTGLAEGKLTIFLWGSKLAGSWGLSRLHGNNWLLVKRDDLFAEPDRDLLKEDRSTISGRTVEDLRAGRPPAYKRASGL